jgi:TonB family protein
MLIAFLMAAAATVPKADAIDPSSWFGGNSYPVEAMKKGIEGSVTFDVDVDSEGKPTACRVTLSSGYQILDQATCDVVQQKGRFIPAKDRDGKPVVGHYSNQAVWRIPTISKEPSSRAVVIDFSADPLHPVCTIQSKGPEMGGPTCAQMAQQAVSQALGQKVSKLVYLNSVAPTGDALYQGEPDWGIRVSRISTDQYFLKGSYPIACTEIAAQGQAAGQDGCKDFPGARTLTDLEKQNAYRRRIEISVFAVMRSGIMELEPGHFRCDEPAGDYVNREIATLPISRPVTVRFKLISEHPDPKWLEQAGLYFETPKGRKRLQVGKANNDPQHMYVALLGDDTGESEIVDQYPLTNDWIDLSLTLKSDGKIQVNSRSHQASLDLGTASTVKTEVHCHSGIFELEVLRPPQ